MNIEQQAAALVAKHGPDAVIEAAGWAMFGEGKMPDSIVSIFQSLPISNYWHKLFYHAAMLATQQITEFNWGEAITEAIEKNGVLRKRPSGTGPSGNGDTPLHWIIMLVDDAIKIAREQERALLGCLEEITEEEQ